MQISLFGTEPIKKIFKPKARGRIYTNKIWKELDVNSKINIKVAYGYGPDLKPNYWIIDTVFKYGLDSYQLLSYEIRHLSGFRCFEAAPKKLKVR